MVDTSLTGTRCRATKEIRSYQGLVRRYSEGIIQYNMDNLGRHLISVQWDNGVIDYVYPLEIEILGQGDEPDFNVVTNKMACADEARNLGITVEPLSQT